MLPSEHLPEGERERLLYQFFKGTISRGMTRAFERLLKQTGYATEFESVCFKSDFEPDEEEFERLSDREVIVQFEPPATGNSVDSYSIVLSFEEFLKYLENTEKE